MHFYIRIRVYMRVFFVPFKKFLNTILGVRQTVWVSVYPVVRYDQVHFSYRAVQKFKVSEKETETWQKLSSIFYKLLSHLSLVSFLVLLRKFANLFTLYLNFFFQKLKMLKGTYYNKMPFVYFGKDPWFIKLVVLIVWDDLMIHYIP